MAARTAKLMVMNPSPYARGGMVITPWQPIAEVLGSSVSNLRVYRDTDSGGREPLFWQIDRLDPDDASRDQLVFALDRPIKAGHEDYTLPSAWVTVEAADPSSGGVGGPKVDTSADDAVGLKNDRLEIWLNLDPEHKKNGNPWFGGCLTSVKIWGFEMLDAIAERWGLPHHHEKRAMQIDRVHLVRPPWDSDVSFDAYLHDKAWRLVAHPEGPLRATATIASDPFPYTCKDVDQNPRTFQCSLYRAVSIYAGSEAIGEEVWLKATPDSGGETVNVWFSLRYFMMVHLTVKPITFRYPSHPGWFALTSPEDPRHGYAFATDANAGPIWNPPLDYGDDDTCHRAYSWELGATRCAHAVHLFRLGTDPHDLSDAAGWAWYDMTYKPIRAAVIAEDARA